MAAGWPPRGGLTRSGAPRPAPASRRDPLRRHGGDIGRTGELATAVARDDDRRRASVDARARAAGGTSAASCHVLTAIHATSALRAPAGARSLHDRACAARTVSCS